MDALNFPPTGAAEAPATLTQRLEAICRRDMARANHDAALRAEGEALAAACEVVNLSGIASPQAAGALRRVQAAHSRATAAAAEARASAAQVHGLAPPSPAAPPPAPARFPHAVTGS